MIKTITLETGDKIELNSSMGWIYTYQESFGHDILVVLMPAIEATLRAALEMMKASPDGSIGSDNIAQILENVEDQVLTDAIITLTGLRFTTLTNIVWSMAKNADESLPAPKEWLNQFETFPLEKLVPEAMKLIIESSVQKKTSTKLMAKLTGIIQSQRTGSQSQESTEV